MTDLITLSGDYGYTPYKIDGVTSTEIDATDAQWIVANSGSSTNLYPVSVRDSGNVTLTGGTINGKVSLETDWVDAYVNSAAVYARNVDNILIQDWKISQAWDAIRLTGSGADTFTIDNVWLRNVRDDGVENDNGLSGTISNSLFDGVFVGVSLADSNTGDKTANAVTLDNVLIRMQSFEYKGELTHQSIFKVKDGVSPQLNIHDSVFAIQDVNHEGQGRLQIAWDSVRSASNNYFLNLSDTPLPADYPRPPAGFTILQGAAARDFWQASRENWISGQSEASVAPKIITGTSASDTLTGTDAIDHMFGQRGSDRLSGAGGADKLFGQKGNDTLRGGDHDDILSGDEGNDQLYGGSGADRFVFRGQGDDRVRDFKLDVDTLAISDAATGGMTDVNQIIKTFASVVGSDVIFEFANGSSILLSGIGSTAGLSDDLVII